MRWFAHAYDVCLYALLAVRRGMPFLLSGTRPECSSVCLLGLSWWWQLHAGQVRWVRNTNALLKRLNTRKWILINRFAESQLASMWGWRHIGPPNQSKYKTASAILQTVVVTLKSCLRVAETKQDVFKLQCLYVFGAREPTLKCFTSWLPALMVSLVTKLPVKALHADHNDDNKRDSQSGSGVRT